MRITVGIPANKPIRPKTVRSLLDMVAVSPYEFLILLPEEGYTPSEKRNWMLVQSLNKECDYTFFSDDDMVFPKETLTTLISRDKDVIGGLYYLKTPDFKLVPVVEGEVSEGIFECQGVGAGLMLIKNSILTKVKTPWFDTKVNGLGQTILGDSYYFCDRVREAGYRVWCDSTLKIGHLGEYIYG